MKVLGIDYGDKRIGLALADSQSIALPYKVINNSGLAQVVSELQSIIEQERIEKIVIGLPYSLSGKTNQRLAITDAFVQQLKSKIILPIVTVNEQFSSKLYERQGVTKNLDQYAAAAILDTWLEQNKQ